MGRVLQSTHAEDVGGVIVEPGQPVPDDADEQVISRLESEGKLADAPKPEKTTKAKGD